MDTPILSPSRPPAAFWLNAASVAWFPLAMLVLALFAGGLPLRYTDLAASVDARLTQQTGITPDGYAKFVTGLSVLVVAGHSIISAILFFRRKWDWMALLLSYSLITGGVVFPLSLAFPKEATTTLVRMLVDLIIFISLVSSLGLLFLFPTGRFVPRQTRWLLAAWAIIHLPGVFLPSHPVSISRWPGLVQLAVLLFFTGAGVAAQFYRYARISNPIQKQQSKWATLGLAASAIGPFAYYLPFIILPTLGGSGEVSNIMFNRIGPQFYAFTFVLQGVGIFLFSVIMLLFPISFAVAILKYRLWEIDIFINRTLVYSSLTGLIFLIFLTSLTLLRQIIYLVTGVYQSDVATAVSTVLVAILFNPLQKRVQAGIDRRFYRHKYENAQTLATFGNELKNEVDLPILVDDLLNVVHRTMQPESVSLWLKPEAGDDLLEAESRSRS